MSENVLFALVITLFAGLSTGIGSAIAFFTKKTNTKFLSVALGLSAGVMIYISFVELLSGSIDMMSEMYGEKNGQLYSILSFFGGVFLIMMIDFLIPEDLNPHEIMEMKDIKGEMTEELRNEIDQKKKTSALMRAGLVSALVMAIHNFPEGMVTFLSALENPTLALPIAIAIAIHNIPEGISVSVPIYYATGNRKKAFWISFSSGLAEPVGALIGYLILAPFLNDTLFGVINAAIAGVMVYISLDELLPTAQKYGHHHHSIVGLIIGMIIMAVSLVYI
ncbi:zinc transporter ZupT [Porphyromonadaceae bacterium W3.11]|nr:zinc transporter ZupT [Porphyromonadaceae bacterium W3.11]